LPEKGVSWSYDTLPHLLTVVLGFVVISLQSLWIASLYLIISFVGWVWFLWRICTCCRAFGNRSCPSGYGSISAKFFKKNDRNFETAFKLNIVSVALQWFIPLLVGIYGLIDGMKATEIISLLSFIAVAFVYLPWASKRKACGTCAQRKDCPWTSTGK
jgi:hypothetical protein